MSLIKGVLRIVKGDDIEDDIKSIDSTQFFLNLVEDIKRREISAK